MILKCLVYFFIFFLIYGCEKDIRNYKIGGTITNSKTGERVRGANLQLYHKEDGIWGSDSYLEGSMETNEEGNYSLKFHPTIRKNSVKYYFLRVSHPLYNEPNSTPDFIIDKANFSFGDKYTFDVTIDPVATLIVKIKNVNPLNQSDWALIDLYYPHPSNYYFALISFNGMYVDTSIQHTVRADRDLVVCKSDNHTNNVVRDTIRCPQFVTTTYTFNY